MTDLLLAGGPSGTQWTSIGVVVTIGAAIITWYYLATQKAAASAAVNRQVTADAIKPYTETIDQLRKDGAAALAQLRADHAAAIADQIRRADADKEELRRNMAAQISQRDDVISTRNQTIRDQNETMRDRDKRIDALEDQLRNGRHS